MRHFLRFVAVTTSLIYMAQGTALAAVVDDPNDTPGRLDVSRFRVVRRASGDVVFTVRFHSEVRNRLFLQRTNWVAVFLNLDADPELELMGGTRAHRGEINPRKVFLSFSFSDPSSPGSGPDLTVRRPDASTLRWVRPEGPGLLAGPFEAAAESSFFRLGLRCDPACLDFAPELGSFLAVS